jgi:hypothetical protein
MLPVLLASVVPAVTVHAVPRFMTNDSSSIACLPGNIKRARKDLATIGWAVMRLLC